MSANRGEGSLIGKHSPVPSGRDDCRAAEDPEPSGTSATSYKMPLYFIRRLRIINSAGDISPDETIP